MTEEIILNLLGESVMAMMLFYLWTRSTQANKELMSYVREMESHHLQRLERQLDAYAQAQADTVRWWREFMTRGSSYPPSPPLAGFGVPLDHSPQGGGSGGTVSTTFSSPQQTTRATASTQAHHLPEAVLAVGFSVN
jgi:hypothetical protein